MTHCIVVDTNVLAVAEGMHDGASDDCVLACTRIVTRLAGGQRLAVDAGDEILLEYLGTLASAASPGAATKLAKTLWRLRWNPDVCHCVAITPSAPPGSYDEVPPPLQDFDDDDQKFLAVAAAEGSVPPIYQAVDQEWWDRRTDLVASGIDVQFLCDPP